MRKYLLLIAYIFTIPMVHAQVEVSLEGTVIYEVVAQLPPPVLPPGMTIIVGSAPDELRTNRRLRFQGDAAISDPAGDSPAGIVVTPAVFYSDYGTGRRVSQLSIDRKAYLVEARTDTVHWQITGEESEYLGYPLLQATATILMREVEAWFTPAIPTSLGPDLYHGLPGLILVLSVDGGQQTFRATSVTLSPLAETVVPPTGSQTVTPEEFRRLQSDYVAAMERALEESAEDDD